METPRATMLAWALFGLTAALTAATIVLTILNGFQPANDWGTGANGIVAGTVGLVFAFVGRLVATRQPGNAVGWICLAVGAGIAANGTAGHYALYAVKTDPGALPGGDVATWLGNWDFYWFVALFVIYLPLLFPSGHLPSARWRAVAWLGAAGTVVLIVSEALLPGPLYSIKGVPNPFGIEGAKPLLTITSAIGGIVYAGCILAAGASVVRRLRRSSGTERAQLKWFAFAAVIVGVAFVPISAVSTDADATRVAGELLSVAFAAIPISVGVAILRYRLYDIDSVISRALVYGALTATLAATYVGTVLVLQLVLPASSDLAIAGSTLAVAALIRPARARIQDVVDRRFFRSRYDAAQALTAFGSRLRDEVSLDAVAAELREATTETLQPAHVSLWIRR